MPSIADEIRRLTPGALRLFKQQLPQRLQQMSEMERNTALQQLSEFPDLLTPDQVGTPQAQPQPQEELPWYHWVEGIGRNFATVAAAPFTPQVEDTEGMSWWEREQKEYEQWQEPSFQVMPWFRLPWTPEEMRDKEWTIGVKGVLQELPWFATTLATAGLGSMGWVGAKTGITGLTKLAQVGSRAIRPIVAAEEAITLAPFRAAKAVVSPALKKFGIEGLPQIARFVPRTIEEYERELVKGDWQRAVAQWFGRKPILKSTVEKVGGRAATVTEEVEDLTARALLVAPRVQDDLLAKGQVAMANLRAIDNNPIRLFGVEEATGLTKIKGKTSGLSKHIADIAEHPNDYILNEAQKAYIDQLHLIEDWVLDGIKEAGIDPKMLKFDEFSHWVHREVIGKNIDDAIEAVRKSSKRIGSKAAWEKTRFYETAAEGAAQGIIYEPSLEKVTDLYIQSAAKRIADQKIAEMTAGLGETALERAAGIAGGAEILRTAKEATRTFQGAKQLQKVINRAIRGEKLPEATLKAQERRFPELAKRLREAVDKPEELKNLLKQAKTLEEQARAPYWKSKAERAALMEQARTPVLGTESTIWHPAFQGKIYPKDVAGEIQRYWDDMGNSYLNKAASISGEMRTLVAAADLSAMTIQGSPSIALHPVAWGKAVKHSLKSWGNLKTHQDFLITHLDDAMELSHYGGYLGGFEMMEAMPQLQKTAGLAGKLIGGETGRRVGKEVVRQTYGRFESQFGAFGDALRIYLWQALKGRAKNADELAEIARHINRMTGVMSQKALGLGKTQVAFEQAFLFFAPRYTRAGFALIGDAFKGGLTGVETRKAILTMAAAGIIGYIGTAKALGQEPELNPTNARFMTLEITDPLTGAKRHFGIGGMMTSMLRFGADVTASIIGAGGNEPLDLIKLDRIDNPFIKFLRTKSAPLTGFLEGMISGKNYFGEPFENAGDYGKFMLEQVLPIAVQQTYMEEGGLTPTAIAGEIAGLRTFPQSDWEKRNNKRDEVAQRIYGMSWDEVGQRMGEMAQNNLLMSDTELQELTQKAQESSDKMARGEGKVWAAWRQEGTDIEETYRQAVIVASREFDQTGDGTKFRERIEEASMVRRALYAQREKNPAYSEVQEYFKEPLTPRDVSRMNINDVARKEYFELLYSDEMYDEYGNYNFDEADRRQAYILQKYGQSAVNYIDEFAGSKWNAPNAFLELERAKRILEPYWDIENRYWSQVPELKAISDQIKILERQDPLRAKRELAKYPQIVLIRKQIAVAKKRLKAQNPQIAEALRRYYTY